MFRSFNRLPIRPTSVPLFRPTGREVRDTFGPSTRPSSWGLRWVPGRDWTSEYPPVSNTLKFVSLFQTKYFEVGLYKRKKGGSWRRVGLSKKSEEVPTLKEGRHAYGE